MIQAYKTRREIQVMTPGRLRLVSFGGLIHGSGYPSEKLVISNNNTNTITAVSRQHLSLLLHQRVAPNIEVPNHPVDMVSRG